MRRALILGLLCILTAVATETPVMDFWEKLARFHDHYNRFMRGYLGCRKNDAYLEQCKPSLGRLDRKSVV